MTLVQLAQAASAADLPGTDLPAPVAAALQAAGVPPEVVSMLVLPVDQGAARLDHEGQAIRQVASVMKLFTTGVALRSLGPAYTWHTDVALGGKLKPNGVLEGPLYIRGSGDPGLVMEKLQMMLTRWRAAGLKQIRGDIVIDRSAFNLQPFDPAAFDGQALKPYNAGPDAFLLNHQAISLRFAPDASKPGQVRVSMEPELDGVQLEAKVTPQAVGACGDWREAMTLRLVPDTMRTPASAGKWRIQLSGPYPASCGPRDWPMLWQGDVPGDHAARLLTSTWRQLGGKLSGRVQVGAWPDAAPAWQSWASPPLGEQVRDINKFSNNVMARQLFLTLAVGAEPATLERARQVVTQQVVDTTKDASGHSPCDAGALVLDNGSGLSRDERSSAACLGKWMQMMWASPVMPEWLASMPIAGLDGTAKRLTSVAGRAHIKTGSLDGVAALAGIVEGDSGRRYAVVGIINHPQADAARPALQALLGWAMKD
jgi:D-alanyl-D-alanine carboxypeptidase/D-alanyl-D-alanine-endopeptidase (penicillin-binding protein 4)